MTRRSAPGAARARTISPGGRLTRGVQRPSIAHPSSTSRRCSSPCGVVSLRSQPRGSGGRFIQHPASYLPRRPFPRTPLNKGKQEAKNNKRGRPEPLLCVGLRPPPCCGRLYLLSCALPLWAPLSTCGTALGAAQLGQERHAAEQRDAFGHGAVPSGGGGDHEGGLRGVRRKAARPERLDAAGRGHEQPHGPQGRGRVT